MEDLRWKIRKFKVEENSVFIRDLDNFTSHLMMTDFLLGTCSVQDKFIVYIIKVNPKSNDRFIFYEYYNLKNKYHCM